MSRERECAASRNAFYARLEAELAVWGEARDRRGGGRAAGGIAANAGFRRPGRKPLAGVTPGSGFR